MNCQARREIYNGWETLKFVECPLQVEFQVRKENFVRGGVQEDVKTIEGKSWCCKVG